MSKPLKHGRYTRTSNKKAYDAAMDRIFGKRSPDHYQRDGRKRTLKKVATPQDADNASIRRRRRAAR